MKQFKVIDMHCDTITGLAHSGKSFYDNDGHISLKKLQEGNSMMQCFAIFIHQMFHQGHCFEAADRYMDVFDGFMKEYSDQISQVRTVEDILKNDSEGKVSALLTIEGGEAIEGSLEKLEHFYDRGVRMMTLTWNFENEIGFPNYMSEQPFRPDTERGLKPFGFECINRMWDLGMIVDVSHLNDAGIYDVLSVARKPIVASHSNSRAVCDIPRNMTDDMIIKLRENGGIMGMNYAPAFISDNRETSQIPDIIRHIRHIADIAGIETVALGSDFDGINTPIGMSDFTRYHDLYEALIADGFSQDDIDKIFYKNFLRVLKANQE